MISFTTCSNAVLVLCFLQCSTSFVLNGMYDYVEENMTASEHGVEVPQEYEAYGEEMTNEAWDEYWSDWQDVGDRRMNETFRNSPYREEDFLSALHSSYRNGEVRRCADKHSGDCSTWADKGYCTHEKTTYRTWMAENCPVSCRLCPPRDESRECRDRRSTCESLQRFCSGIFERHMTTYCPRTCNLCNRQPPAEQEGANREGRNGTTSTSRSAPRQAAQAPSSATCFPSMCGVAPVMERRGRAKRSLRNKRSLVNFKIVGGMRTRKGKWPWHGMIMQQINERVRFCGVTIICRNWVVTAAHCVASPEYGTRVTRHIMKTFSMFVGRHQGVFGGSDESTQAFYFRDFERFVIHPDFRLSPSFSHDIALIKLSTPIIFNAYVQPVCLSTINDLHDGDALITYGWGETMSHGPSGETLKEISLPFVSKERCRRQVWGLEATGTICAGGMRNKDACTGDSGGSLVKSKPVNGTRNGRYFFYGITSYGTYYCNSRVPYKPGVYTDIAHYYDWIRDETNGCCPNSSPVPTPSNRDSAPRDVRRSNQSSSGRQGNVERGSVSTHNQATE